ncbi:hypothetical protein BSKO_05790 [Bryopsis sp. KO-2023]|nr:hypothetical protein BSKO_05790 [Bryopsis sp. KO-2023]
MGNDDVLEDSAEERLQKAAVARIFRVAREKRTKSFFFSNDDLLELLALAEKFLGVQPHPRKFFESIDSLVFASNLEVAAINSEETETAPFGEFCGNVENWLGAVKKLMLDSVRHQMDESVEAGTTDVMGLTDTGDLSWQDRETVITEFEWGSQLWHDEMMDMVQASNAYGHLGKSPRVEITPSTECSGKMKEDPRMDPCITSWCQQLPPKAKVLDHMLKIVLRAVGRQGKGIVMMTQPMMFSPGSTSAGKKAMESSKTMVDDSDRNRWVASLQNGGGGGGGIAKTGTSDNGMCGNDPSNCEYVSNITVNNVLGCWRSSSPQQIEYVKREENGKLDKELGFLKTEAKLLVGIRSDADTSNLNMEDILISGIREKEAHVAHNPTMQDEKRRVLREIDMMNGLVNAVTSTRSNEVDQPQKENAQLKSSVQMLRSDLMSTENDAYMEDYDMFRAEIGEGSQIDIGMDKLLSRRNEMEVLQRKLEELQPVLARTAEEVKQMMVEMTEEKKEADEKKKVAHKREKDFEDAIGKVADAQKNLDEALAAVNAAESCVMNVSREDIIEIKPFISPPNNVKLVMAAAYILFDVQPEKIVKKGNKFADHWLDAKKMVCKPTCFLEDLRNFEKNNVKEVVMKKLEPYITNNNFTAQKIEKTSRACMAICSWVRSIYAYHKVGLQVASRRVAIEEAAKKLSETTRELSIAQRKFEWREAKINSLEEKFKLAMAKKDALSKQVKDCRTKRQIVEEIIGGLSGKSLAVPPPWH